MERDGRHTATRLSPPGAPQPGCAHPASFVSLPPPGSGTGTMWSPAQPEVPGARQSQSHPTQKGPEVCQGPPAWRLAQLDRTRFWGLGEGRTRRKRGRGRDGLGESPFSIPSKPRRCWGLFFSFLFPTPLVSQECLKLHFFEEGGGNPWFPWGSNERQPAHLQDQGGGRGLLRIPRPGGQVSRPAVAARTFAFFPDRALLIHRFLWFPA